MNHKERIPAIILRTLLGLMIVTSIAITYQVKFVAQDFVIKTNPEGPDVSDYFE